jgi:hypothetical protein
MNAPKSRVDNPKKRRMHFDQLNRREFITLLGGAAAAWPLAARAQQPKLARIGALYIGTADEEAFKTNLRDGLRELGYVEGQNIAFESPRKESWIGFLSSRPSLSGSRLM